MPSLSVHSQWSQIFTLRCILLLIKHIYMKVENWAPEAPKFGSKWTFRINFTQLWSASPAHHLLCVSNIYTDMHFSSNQTQTSPINTNSPYLKIENWAPEAAKFGSEWTFKINFPPLWSAFPTHRLFLVSNICTDGSWFILLDAAFCSR